MSKVVAIAGVGPGISLAAAKKFGQQGFKVALISRTESKLKQYAADLAAIGVHAEAFPADIHNLQALEGVYSDIQAKLGPITVLLWNEYSHIFDPVLAQSVEQLESQFKSLTSMIRSIQLAAAQQEGQPQNKPATIITGGGLSQTENEELHPIIAQLNFNIPASIGACKHSLAATLRYTLQPKGIRVREVMVTKVVKGSALDAGQADALDPAIIAEAFWKQYSDEDAPWITRL